MHMFNEQKYQEEYRRKNNQKLKLWKKTYYKEHKTDILTGRKKNRENNKNKIKLNQHIWWEKNKHRKDIKEWKKEYYKAHKNDIQLYREKNKSHIKEVRKNWLEKNKNHIKKYRQKYNKKTRLQRKVYMKKWHLSHKKHNKKYQIENKDKNVLYRKQWEKENVEHRRQCRKKWENVNKQYRRKYRNEYMKNKEKTDINFKIKNRLCNRIRDVIKNNSKSGHTTNLIDCSIPFFKKYIELQFLPEMSWDNYGTGKNSWTFDHIRPCASFDNINDPKQQQLCFHFLNQQPMWWEDNIRKNDKYDDNDKLNWIEIETQINKLKEMTPIEKNNALKLILNKKEQSRKI